MVSSEVGRRCLFDGVIAPTRSPCMLTIINSSGDINPFANPLGVVRMRSGPRRALIFPEAPSIYWLRCINCPMRQICSRSSDSESTLFMGTNPAKQRQLENLQITIHMSKTDVAQPIALHVQRREDISLFMRAIAVLISHHLA